ncbi:MAG TPA: Gfo/Idh/MocA family oxidoreductase [Chthonomonadaceae bacterium]|nr:Gfo/Idh/MocA family oxidoreductase [Chthonomonadaceae bacterium]
MKQVPPPISRRSFLAGAAALAGGMAADARPAKASRSRRRAAGEKLRVAVVGAGGRGADNISDLHDTGAQIVALCDCDLRSAAESFGRYPDAKQYTDWRKLLEAEKDFDAVLVATPDHNHAIISVSAMQLGKHVYCEKPLAHSVWEARQMAKVAAEKGVVTQMGTQGHAFEGTRRAVEVMRAGTLGDVTELHVWTDRPAGWWPQGIARPKETPPVPKELDWDVWLGPAPERPYNPAYVPFKWRGFWDFGTGAIGDMGIHNLDTAFWGLQLGAPTSVEIKDCSPALTDPTMKETAPLWSILELHFPARGSQPPVKMTWYDGGKLPPRELFQGEKLISKDGGSLVIGTKGTLFTRTWHGGETEEDMFVLLPRKQFAEFTPPAPTLPRTRSHHHEWVDACLGHGQALSHFGYAAVLTESLLLGNVALRVGRRIEWDAAQMRARNAAEADAYIRPAFRKGWTL